MAKGDNGPCQACGENNFHTKECSRRLTLGAYVTKYDRETPYPATGFTEVKAEREDS